MRSHHMRAHTWHRVNSALFGAGLLLILITTIDVDELPVYRLGVVLALLGGIRLVLDKVTADAVDMEAGRQSGYDDGYDDGCSVRPSSKFSAVGSAVARLPRSGPAQQLSEHGDVGGGEQRIV